MHEGWGESKIKEELHRSERGEKKGRERDSEKEGDREKKAQICRDKRAVIERGRTGVLETQILHCFLCPRERGRKGW